jgi:hypothetical protein
MNINFWSVTLVSNAFGLCPKVAFVCWLTMQQGFIVLPHDVYQTMLAFSFDQQLARFSVRSVATVKPPTMWVRSGVKNKAEMEESR